MMQKSGGMGAGLLLALIIGVVAGLLLAPRKGEETRQLLRKKAMEARDKMKQRMTSPVKSAQQAADKAAERARDIADQTSRSNGNGSMPR